MIVFSILGCILYIPLPKSLWITNDIDQPDAGDYEKAALIAQCTMKAVLLPMNQFYYPESWSTIRGYKCEAHSSL